MIMFGENTHTKVHNVKEEFRVKLCTILYDKIYSRFIDI